MSAQTRNRRKAAKVALVAPAARAELRKGWRGVAELAVDLGAMPEAMTLFQAADAADAAIRAQHEWMVPFPLPEANACEVLTTALRRFARAETMRLRCLLGPIAVLAGTAMLELLDEAEAKADAPEVVDPSEPPAREPRRDIYG